MCANRWTRNGWASLTFVQMIQSEFDQLVRRRHDCSACSVVVELRVACLSDSRSRLVGVILARQVSALSADFHHDLPKVFSPKKKIQIMLRASCSPKSLFDGIGTLRHDDELESRGEPCVLTLRFPSCEQSGNWYQMRRCQTSHTHVQKKRSL